MFRYPKSPIQMPAEYAVEAPLWKLCKKNKDAAALRRLAFTFCNFLIHKVLSWQSQSPDGGTVLFRDLWPLCQARRTQSDFLSHASGTYWAVHFPVRAIFPGSGISYGMSLEPE
jgi:hypothetical protein